MIKKLFARKAEIILFFILIISIFLRFVNFPNRWQLSYDQARDTIVATYALNNHLIPLTGPFSSAGKFIYGPQWFWILYAYISIYKDFLLTPWIIHALIWSGMSFVMYLIGKEILGRKFGLLLSFFAAISWAQINIATNLISPSMAGIFSIISIYFFIRFIKYSKKLDSFLLGFFVANTINIHFQGIGLMVLLPVGLIFGRKDIKNFLALCLGFFIPFIPLIIFDLKTNFFETRNILDYYFYGQYRIYVPNRWLTYAGVFWPKIWSFVIGIKEIVGYLLLILMALISFFEIWKKKIDKNMLSLIVSFFVIFIWLRYYRGELFDSYLIFLHPFVLIFSAWVIYKIFKFNKIIAILLFFVIAFFTIQKDLIEISMAKTPTGKNIEQWKKAIEEKFPNDKFAVYIYKYENSEKALPIILYLNADKRIQDNGRKIGISFNGDKINVLRLKEIPKDYIFINPSAVYKSVEEWYSNN